MCCTRSSSFARKEIKKQKSPKTEICENESLLCKYNSSKSLTKREIKELAKKAKRDNETIESLIITGNIKHLPKYNSIVEENNNGTFEEQETLNNAQDGFLVIQKTRSYDLVFYVLFIILTIFF